MRRRHIALFVVGSSVVILLCGDYGDTKAAGIGDGGMDIRNKNTERILGVKRAELVVGEEEREKDE